MYMTYWTGFSQMADTVQGTLMGKCHGFRTMFDGPADLRGASGVRRLSERAAGFAILTVTHAGSLESAASLPSPLRSAFMSRKSRMSQGRKPRTEYIYGTTLGGDSRIVIHVDSATREISFGQRMENVYLERSCERPKGPKVVSRIPQAQAELLFDEAAAFDKNFDHLFAVDTNTKPVGEKTISVVGVVTIANAPSAPGDRSRTWQFGVPFCLEYSDLRTKPEPFGWLEALGILAQQGRFIRGQRIGLIVDSELGALRAYNDRTMPVDTGRILPPGVTLVYASGDSAAAQVLAALENSRLLMPTAPAGCPLFDTVRIVDPKINFGPPSPPLIRHA
jgi:hypothetical protein